MNASDRKRVVAEVFGLLAEDLPDHAESAELPTGHLKVTIYTKHSIARALATLEKAYLQTIDDDVPMEDWL